MRDIDLLKRQAEDHGPHIGQLATLLLEGPLPWTRMRRVYALLGLVRKYGQDRVDAVCATAIAFDMHDVRRLQRMLEQGAALPSLAPPEAPKVIPLARYLRAPSQYALPLASREQASLDHPQGDDR